MPRNFKVTVDVDELFELAYTNKCKWTTNEKARIGLPKVIPKPF